MTDTIETLSNEKRIIPASDEFKANATHSDPEIYKLAAADRLGFWEAQASQLHWFSPWTSVLEWERPFAKWFVGGTINASYNCLDVHLDTDRRDKAAVVWEGELGDVRTFTYAELHHEVARFSTVLTTRYGIQKGDRVTIYMPLIPESVVAILACARIGAIHSVVFGGFSAQSLIDRIHDSGSRLVITADGGYRRGKVVPLKSIVDEAMEKCPAIEAVVVVRHVRNEIKMQPGRDDEYQSVMADTTDLQEAVPMDSEDPLFILYTSGTTGKPKGIVHTTGGYMAHAKYSAQLVFDLKPSDVYWCTADVGWITGHTYLVYGPLANGATVMMYEGSPDYPDKDRFWEVIERHKVTILYTAPTAIRAFMKWGNHLPEKHDLSSLRLLGSVGEPINPEAWMWYYTVIGKGRCPVVDTWWQTETGGIMISTLPALSPMRPGYTGLPLPGIDVQVLHESGKPVEIGGGLLSIMSPWPSMARGIWGDNDRFKSVYWDTFDTYFAGDGATVDDDGYIMVLGRVDDVLNVAGHRIGTMEVESALVEFDGVAEAAVVGIADELKGQAILAFVILKEGVTPSDEFERAAIDWVSKAIGAIAKPKRIIFTPDLPKTRSGKIMRRLLKSVANGQPLGDVTTLANPEVVGFLEQQLSIKVDLSYPPTN